MSKATKIVLGTVGISLVIAAILVVNLAVAT